jgi:hypothetical protein
MTIYAQLEHIIEKGIFDVALRDTKLKFHGITNVS